MRPRRSILAAIVTGTVALDVACSERRNSLTQTSSTKATLRTLSAVRRILTGFHLTSVHASSIDGSGLDFAHTGGLRRLRASSFAARTGLGQPMLRAARGG